MNNQSEKKADVLFNSAMNDKKAYNMLCFALKHLREAVDKVAEKVAKSRAEFHDDPSAEDHEAFHAPASEQFPWEVRDHAVRVIVSHLLGEIQRGGK